MAIERPRLRDTRVGGRGRFVTGVETRVLSDSLRPTRTSSRPASRCDFNMPKVKRTIYSTKKSSARLIELAEHTRSKRYAVDVLPNGENLWRNAVVLGCCTTVCERTDTLYKIARIENEVGVVEKGRRMSDVTSRNTGWWSPEQLQHLTPRQVQIASLASQGFSNKEVGRRLNVSEGTVKLHLHSIYTRLGLRNRTQLASIVLSSR